MNISHLLKESFGLNEVELPANVLSWIDYNVGGIIKACDLDDGPYDTVAGVVVYITHNPGFRSHGLYSKRDNAIVINGSYSFSESELHDLLVHEFTHALDVRSDRDSVSGGRSGNMHSNTEIAAYTNSIINTLKRLISDDIWKEQIREFLNGGVFPYFAGTLGRNYKPFVDGLDADELEFFKARLVKSLGQLK